MAAFKNKDKKPSEDNGIYVYVGPSIKGVIQEGTIYHGSLDKIHRKLAAAIEKYPKIARLIVKDTELSAARAEIRKGGTSLAHAYETVSK
ncbi:MAG: hypothetical protein IKN17_05925 [Ruminococcus sp.]|nr:hypothetical protein [Ruminococcus sp.]